MMKQEPWSFLDQYRIGTLTEEELENYAPIFYEEDAQGPQFLPGYACNVGGKARAKFMAEAPKGLYLGGGALTIYVPQGIVSVPDRRHGGNAGPSAQGRAKYSEGAELSKAAFREAGEEIIVYTLSGEGDNLYQPCTEVVPAGMSPKGRVETLNLPLDDCQYYGQINFLTYCRNEKDRAWIHVGVWDLRGLPNADRLRIIWNDDFPGGRLPGTNPRVLGWDTGKEVGRFEGLQGYLPNDMPFHPVMEAVMRCT